VAIGRLSVKVGKAGRAAPHAAYIAREGKYANRRGGERLEATEAGNMPKWAQQNPQLFWQSADAFERKNGSTYREFEIALPRELNAEQRLALVRDWVRQEIGDRHAYQWAIHVSTAADGGEQPHLHLMFSERQVDGIERDPEQYFKRYNPKSPEKGGARKGWGPNAGKTLTRAERAAELKELRRRWQDMCNAHLERAGVSQRIDMRSHAERGTGLEPERKQLPSEWRGHGRAAVIEFRQARRELIEARAELARVVPDARAELEAREQAEREQERQRLASMSSRELAQEIARLRPPPVHELVERDPDVIKAEREYRELWERHQAAQAREERARREAEQWRRDHPLRAWAHDAGIFRSSYLCERAEIEAEARRERETAAMRLEDAALRERQARREAEARIIAEQAPARAKLAELELIREWRARQEHEQQRRERERRQEREIDNDWGFSGESSTSERRCENDWEPHR